MKALKRLAYIVSTFSFSAFSLLVYAPQAAANSYYGGNWKLTFYSPVDHDDSAQEVYTINPDGTEFTRITDDDTQQANPQWAPSTSSRQIAFDQVDTDNRNIYIQNIDSNGAASGSPTVLSGANTSENEWDPSWSPDGNTIAFHRRTTVGGSGPNHIFTINSSGGTAAARTGGGVTNDDWRDTEPTWNKDGDTLVFTRADTSDDSTVIATVPSDGDEADVDTIPGSAGSTSPQWSPLTNTIVFQKGGEIWTYTIGDGSAQQLTSSAAYPYAPTYSPDGKLIAANNSGTVGFYNAATGALLDATAIPTNATLGYSASEGPQEIDWARASTPANTVHECTTYVNEDCEDSDFDPQIPNICSTGNLSAITTQADNGDPSYSGGDFTYSPDEDYVGEDQYVYRYYDEYMNARTCTVNIAVLPLAPDTGAPNDSRTTLIGAITAGGALTAGFIYKKKRFSRR